MSLALTAHAASITLVVAALACTVVPVRRGGAARAAERVAAIAMVVATVDMVVTEIRVLPVIAWGAGFMALGLIVVIAATWKRAVRRGRIEVGDDAAGVDRTDASTRAEIGRHAGGLLLMAAMWLAMAGEPSGDVVGTISLDPLRHDHESDTSMALPVLVAGGAMAIAAIGTKIRKGSSTSAHWTDWRHPLMAVGMLLMTVGMPFG